MKACVYTLGCKVNTYESEYMMNILENAGFTLVDFTEKADVYVLNSCTVTNTADTKSKKVIREMIRKNEDAVICVVGCYVQNHFEEIKDNQDIHIMLGNKDKSKLVQYINEYLATKQRIVKCYDMHEQEFETMEISEFKSKTRAFVKIQDGCNNFCSYCIIPFVRGNIRYKKREDVLKEITSLVSNGYYEIVLTGIHTGSYGSSEYNFTSLVKDILQIVGLKRLRISSIEITEIDDELIELFKNNSLLADHLHIPLQAGSNHILKLMNRKYDLAFYEDFIKKIRSVRPSMAITTDIIVGFPGETDSDFLNTLDFVRKINFSFVHVFPYSERKGTVAARLDGKVDVAIRKERARTLGVLAKCLDKEYMSNFMNKRVSVLVEMEKDGFLFGHTTNYLKVKFLGSNDLINTEVAVLITNLEYPYCLGQID